MEHGDIMSKTPYELVGQDALYQMIDYFYYLVERDNRINIYFQGTLMKQAESRNSFNSISWRP